MKHLILILFSIILIGCSSFKPVYKSGYTVDINHVIDSIAEVDNLPIPSIKRWISTCYVTEDKSKYNVKSYYNKIGKRQYIITISGDSIYYWTYRIE